MQTRLLTLALSACMMLAAPSFAETTRVNLLGYPSTAPAAVRSIVITPDTKWVNVEGGEIINFIVGDKSFAWHFYVGFTVSSFDLRLVAPPGLLQRRIVAYVSPDPMYRGRD